jgi:hypothetical protein
MTSFPHLMVRIAATAGIATMLSAAAPAGAAESAVIAREAAAGIAPSATKRHVLRESRIGASRRDRRVSQLRSNLDCSGTWCGRQFVLMVGIGY